MTLFAPAKTFFIGEYVATVGGPSIILASQPSFSLSIDDDVSGLVNIHPESPAGLWYTQQDKKPSGLKFNDPYQGMGGLGASSAQFVLVYQAVKKFQNQKCDVHTLLIDYFQYAWHGKGIRPSGYDVLSQYMGNTLFIDKQGDILKLQDWPFPEINALLIHTHNKLATHLHLAQKIQPPIEELQELVYQAQYAWESADAQDMVEAINRYYGELTKQQLVAEHTINLVDCFKQQTGVVAAKGCGAMGADVILLLVEKNNSKLIRNFIENKGLSLLAEIAISS